MEICTLNRLSKQRHTYGEEKLEMKKGTVLCAAECKHNKGDGYYKVCSHPKMQSIASKEGVARIYKESCEFESDEEEIILQIGDTLECSDVEDMINTSEILAKENIMTDFMYENNGKKGYWLIVVDQDYYSSAPF